MNGDGGGFTDSANSYKCTMDNIIEGASNCHMGALTGLRVQIVFMCL